MEELKVFELQDYCVDLGFHKDGKFGAITSNSFRLYDPLEDEHELQVDFPDSRLVKMSWGTEIVAMGALDGSVHILDLTNELTQ